MTFHSCLKQAKGCHEKKAVLDFYCSNKLSKNWKGTIYYSSHKLLRDGHHTRSVPYYYYTPELTEHGRYSVNISLVMHEKQLRNKSTGEEI